MIILSWPDDAFVFNESRALTMKVNVPAAVTVAASIASLNVAVTVALIATFVAPSTGDVVVTVGGVVSGAAAVVNVDVN